MLAIELFVSARTVASGQWLFGVQVRTTSLLSVTREVIPCVALLRVRGRIEGCVR